MRALLSLVALGALGCASPEAPAGPQLVPGERLGDVTLDMTYVQVVEVLGEPTGALVDSRIGFARFEGDVEVVFTSPEADALTDDSRIIGIGLGTAGDYAGPALPGATRAEVEAALGPAPDSIESIDYYPHGISVEYDGDTVFRVAVLPPYERRPDVPPMVGVDR